VADTVQVACVAIEELEAPCSSGLLVANPPYGRRLAGGLGAYRALGAALRGPLRGWRWAVVVPGGEARRALGLTPGASHWFRNGGIGLCFEIGGPHGD
jgi:23S rRNA G2445 N2-methylase RlmL